MSYQDTYQQFLNYYNNPDTVPAPDISIAQPQAPSQSQAQIAQGAGLAGKGAGIYAGGKLGGALGMGGKTGALAAPKIVGAKVVGSGAGATGAGTAGASGAGASGGLGAVGSVALPALAAIGTGASLYNYGGRQVLGGKGDKGDYANLGIAALVPGGVMLNPMLDALGLGSASELLGISGGKSEEQRAREGTRGALAELGLLRDDNGQGYLAEFEGQDPYLMGFSGDFNNQDRSIKDLARVLAKDAGGMNENRNSWDIDYTSDLDFMTNLASEGLGGLLMGDMGDQQKQIFRELTNASLADTDREFNQENWANTIGDIRGLYEKAGITDANIANQRIEELVNQGLEQQQIDQLRQASGLVFGDNSFDLAQDLNAGRWGNDLEYAGLTNPDPMAQTRPMVNVMPQLSQEQLNGMLAGEAQQKDEKLLASLAGALA